MDPGVHVSGSGQAQADQPPLSISVPSILLAWHGAALVGSWPWPQTSAETERTHPVIVDLQLQSLQRAAVGHVLFRYLTCGALGQSSTHSSDSPCKIY